MRLLPILILATALPAAAQSVTSEPIGFNKVTCLANSDTIVGVPLRKEGSQTTKLSGAPTGTGDAITLTVTATLTAGAFTKHYVKFTTGTKEGFWYDISSNTADSITIDLNGDSLTGVVSGDSILIAEYWTLDNLFPPSAATTAWVETPAGSGNWVPSGHAIVKSPSALSRTSELLLPNYEGQGTNLAPGGTYYITGTTPIWRKVNSASTTLGATLLFPDAYFIIRNNSSVAHDTTFRTTGEVVTGKMAIPLSTRAEGKQDNYIAILRPIDVKLKDLGLSDTAFRNSASALNRTDELLAFATDTAVKNRAPSATYYRVLVSGVPQWRSTSTGSTSKDDAVIPAGMGFIIRKAAAVGGATVFWTNPASY